MSRLKTGPGPGFSKIPGPLLLFYKKQKYFPIVFTFFCAFVLDHQMFSINDFEIFVTEVQKILAIFCLSDILGASSSVGHMEACVRHMLGYY
jgi:hypothetical protein